MPAAPEPTLLQRTIDLYSNAPRSLKAKTIAEATGLSEAWLSRFGRGMIANPGVVQVQILHDYLKGFEA